MLAQPCLAPDGPSLIQQPTTILLASMDRGLIANLEGIFDAEGWRLETVKAGRCESLLATMRAVETSAILLLDLRAAGDGKLLAAIHETGLRQRFAIALIADRVSDEWIARLREGAIDDIVPTDASALEWMTHLNTIQRSHQLSREVEALREQMGAEMGTGARCDLVTGILNREAVLSQLFRETERAKRLKGELCLVAVGLDGFDHWRRKLGKEACNRILRTVAQRLGLGLRSYDLLGRSGRAEFLMALPGCSPFTALSQVERLRTAVFDEPFTVTVGAKDIRQIRMTASFGIAASKGRSPLVVVREAEETMEVARLSGPRTIRRAGSNADDEATVGGVRLYSEVAG